MIKDEELIIFDIETPANCFVVCSYEPSTDTKREFKITKEKGDIKDVLKYLDDNKDKYWVSWNGIGFDNQVIEQIYRNGDFLLMATNREIIDYIYDYSQDVIKVSNHKGFHKYKEYQFTFKPLDLYKIHHFDNRNRMSNGSLKNMEYYLGMDIDTYEFDFTKKEIDDEELAKITKYCHHDVYATWLMYLLTTGRVDKLPEYVPNWIKDLHRENDQIQMRIDIGDSFNMACLNWSTTRIGTEITKQFYCKEKGITTKELPKKGMFRKIIKLKHCIPDFIKFKTPEYQKLLKELKETVITEDEKVEHKVSLPLTKLYVTIAKGGIHSTNNWNIFEKNQQYKIIDADVASFYNATIINNKVGPYHLDAESFYKGVEKMYQQRLELKPKAKTDQKLEGVVKGLKEGLVSVYGKLGDLDSPFRDIQAMLTVTFTGQLVILMLIEELALNDIATVMANTDGITCYIPIKKEQIFHEICAKWENKTKYILEYKEYKKMIMRGVNDYVAFDLDGEEKTKGDTFLKDITIFKNKSQRICSLALIEYFKNSTPVEEFIKNHKEIDDFCIRAKVNRNFYIEHVSDNKVVKYDKLLRYYISTDGGSLIKVKRDTCTTNAAPRSEFNKGFKSTILQKIDNKAMPTNINYDYYINKCQEVISCFKTGKKITLKEKNKNQLSLF